MFSPRELHIIIFIFIIFIFSFLPPTMPLYYVAVFYDPTSLITRESMMSEEAVTLQLRKHLKY